MGEIAEMMLEGFLDEETGELIDGTAPGYPRRASDREFPVVKNHSAGTSKSWKRRQRRKRAAERQA